MKLSYKVEVIGQFHGVTHMKASYKKLNIVVMVCNNGWTTIKYKTSI